MIKRNEQGILIVVSGPSGCGPSTVDNLLIKKRKNIIMFIQCCSKIDRQSSYRPKTNTGRCKKCNSTKQWHD